MLGFLRRLFGGRDRDTGGDGELWIAPLGDPESAGFRLSTDGRYAVRPSDGGIELELRKGSLFAWAEAPGRVAADFACKARFRFLEAPGHAAAGLIFRASGERDFVHILVSNRGYARMDAIFNGDPRTIVPWTELPSGPGSTFELMVTARGAIWTAFVDGAWVFEGEDETAESGSIAFAAQTYADCPGARFSLDELALETRPGEIEKAHWSWLASMPPALSSRIALARGLHAEGSHLAALVQLRRAEKDAPLDADAWFLRAEAAIRLELWEEAGSALDACLELEPDRNDAREERANLLYLRSRYPELRDLLEGDRARTELSPRLSNLLGHALWNSGDWAGAAAAYGRAAELESDMPIFEANRARALEEGGRLEEALESWRRAARLFAAEEAPDDLRACIERMAAIAPRDGDLAALRARLLYTEGDFAEASKALERLAKAGTEDSSVWYLAGLLRSRRGDRKGALPYLERAVELEPDFAPFRFRLAEARFLTGGEVGDELAKALELAPTDGWMLNLDGMVAQASGELARAEASFRSALAALPAEVDPALNLASLLTASGRAAESLGILAPFDEDARALNQLGNALVTLGRLEDAADAYARAVRAAVAAGFRAEDAAEFRNNRAACLVELGLWSDAEECLRASLSEAPGARAYALAGRVAEELGDLVRAETAWRAALELEPADARTREALARNYLIRRRDARFREELERLAGLDPERAAKLESDFLEVSTEPISCSGCGRLWRVPRPVPPTSARSLRIVPPDEVPAGSCPSCGRIWCVACRKDSVGDDGRMTCPECGEALKLNDERLRYLVHEGLAKGSRPG
ncbi:MAG: tetratricopeptide repeat protein [Spirochaetales bacterium]|nr:tetratricopeptide repeat protein [Spirochaetales bacterium]